MQKSIRIGATIIANAIVWGAVIIGCSNALKGTGMYQEIQNILAAGSTVTMLIIFAGMMPFKMKEGEAKEPEQNEEK